MKENQAVWSGCYVGSPSRYAQPQREWTREEEENYRDRQPRIWTDPPPQGSELNPNLSYMSALAALGSPAAKNLARMIEASQHGQYAPDQASKNTQV